VERELSPEQSASFATLYERHHQEVFRLCWKFAAGDRSWALDRTHDVFVRLAERLPALKDTHESGGWLYRVAVNVCFTALKRQQLWKKVAALLPGGDERTAAPDAQVLARQELQALVKALDRLPAKERALVVLVVLEGKSQNEAAALLGLSKGYVSKLHERALSMLRAQEGGLAYGR
jgi:RNA polymerase sigma-70 factor (ECF subfamily)